jgi:hypothetical protein
MIAYKKIKVYYLDVPIQPCSHPGAVAAEARVEGGQLTPHFLKFGSNFSVLTFIISDFLVT